MDTNYDADDIELHLAMKARVIARHLLCVARAELLMMIRLRYDGKIVRAQKLRTLIFMLLLIVRFCVFVLICRCAFHNELII